MHDLANLYDEIKKKLEASKKKEPTLEQASKVLSAGLDNLVITDEAITNLDVLRNLCLTYEEKDASCFALMHHTRVLIEFKRMVFRKWPEDFSPKIAQLEKQLDEHEGDRDAQKEITENIQKLFDEKRSRETALVSQKMEDIKSITRPRKQINQFQKQLYARYISQYKKQTDPKYKALSQLKDKIIDNYDAIIRSEKTLLDIIETWKKELMRVDEKHLTHYEWISIVPGKVTKLLAWMQDSKKTPEQDFIDCYVALLSSQEVKPPAPSSIKNE